MIDGSLNILIVDEESYSRTFLSSLLEEEGYKVTSAVDGSRCLELLKSNSFDLALLDLKVAPLAGANVLRSMMVAQPDLPIIVMATFNSIDIAIEAIKLGAADYLTKPLQDRNSIKILIDSVIEQRIIERETHNQEVQEGRTAADKLIFVSSQMQEVMNLVEKIAGLESTVLITGESGTRKEIVARIIHNHSPRANELFFALNCAGLPQLQLESILFGHERGAFEGALQSSKGYFEKASDGTVFLDEIGKISTEFQTKILQVLSERKFRRIGGTTDIATNVRVIAASNINLQQAASQKSFRQDLYDRLNVINIHLSPLRERKSDIPLLAQTFLTQFSARSDKNIKGLEPETVQILERYSWHGNVRELIKVLEYAVKTETSAHLTPGSLPNYITNQLPVPEYPPPSSSSSSAKNAEEITKYKQAIDNFQRNYFTRLLYLAEGNVSRAAELSGIQRQNLYLKLKKYDLDPDDFRN